MLTYLELLQSCSTLCGKCSGTRAPGLHQRCSLAYPAVHALHNNSLNLLLVQFVTGFAAPQPGAKWQGRVKCNLYNYRTNYSLALAAVLVAAFYRHLLSLPALALCGAGCLCLNDTFATSVRCGQLACRADERVQLSIS